MTIYKQQNLYFIALIPNHELREEVKSLKEEIKDKFGAKHALKSPAHITLIPPFKRDYQQESFISDCLLGFAAAQHGFSVEITGFGSFPPRVIYIDIDNHSPIRQLHSALRKTFLDESLFHPDELPAKISPHMTLATRDLSQESYHKAWQEFKKRPFHTTFEVNSVFLLKHNGKFWDIYKEFGYRNNS